MLFQRVGIHHLVKALHRQHAVEVAPAGTCRSHEQRLVTGVLDHFRNGPGNGLAAHVTQGQRRDGCGEQNGFQRWVGTSMGRIKIAEVTGFLQGGRQTAQHIKLRPLVQHGLGAPRLHQEEHQVLLGRASGQGFVRREGRLDFGIAAVGQAQHLGCCLGRVKAHGLEPGQRILQILRRAPAVPRVLEGNGSVGHHVVEELRGRHCEVLALQGHLTDRALAGKEQCKEHEDDRDELECRMAGLQHNIRLQTTHQHTMKSH